MELLKVNDRMRRTLEARVGNKHNQLPGRGVQHGNYPLFV